MVLIINFKEAGQNVFYEHTAAEEVQCLPAICDLKTLHLERF